MILSKAEIDLIDIDYQINEKIISGKLNQLLLIVPTNRKLRSLKKEIINLSPNKASAKINIETIGTFASKLLFVNSGSGRILSEAAASILLKQSFNESLNAGKINYFSSYKNEIPAGTLDRVMNVISEYKKHGISPDKLRQETEELHGSEKFKAEDISEIYEVYVKKCSELSAKDIGDVYNELNTFPGKKFAGNFRELYSDVDTVVINGFDEFTIPEIKIINSTAEINALTLFLSFDYYDKNPLIFSHLDKCYEDLRRRGFNEISDKSVAAYPFKSFVMEKLFSFSRERSGYKKESITSSIEEEENFYTKIQAATREEEIELIAKEIKYLITEKKAAPSQICVGFNLIRSYSPIIRDIFTTYGLPFNLTDRLPLSTSQPVISVLNFLEIVENDFYYKNIFRALSGGYLSIDGINLYYLLKASVDLKIISGYENWRQTLRDALLLNRNEEDSLEKQEYLKNIYGKALLDIEKLYRYLKPFDRKMTLSEFYEKLTELVFNMDIPSMLINKSSIAVEENIKGVTVFFDTLKEITLLLEKEYGKQSRFSLKFFLNNIRTMMNSARYNISEKPGYGIQVTTINEIRGLQFDYLFISGLCDGDFPTRYTPEIFFSGSSRTKRNELNHQVEERYRFYQALCCWRKKLYFTTPKQDERKELVESNFITEFEKLFPVQIKTEKDYSDKLYSKEELLIHAGINGAGEVKKIFPGKDLELIFSQIENSIRVDRIRRESPFGDSEYTGSIYKQLSPTAKEELNSLKENEYSISQLETFAKCPYRYFAERILMLKEVEEPTEEIEAIEMGSILHKILYEFYTELRNRKIILYLADKKQIREAEELLFGIAEKNIEKANFSSPLAFFEKEKILGINGDRKNSILYKFLEEEIKSADGFVPELLEITFSSKGSEEISVEPQLNKNIKVRGKIDRIDINRSGNSLRVMDYKLSGKKPANEELLNGISLQLPLYLYAAKHLINAQLNKDFNLEAGIYSLKFREGHFGYTEIRAGTPHKLIEICLDAIEKYITEINHGKFHLSDIEGRENKACRFCSFKSICRIREIN
jgi:ATP-dependent helicase/nuclease subunit B